MVARWEARLVVEMMIVDRRSLAASDGEVRQWTRLRYWALRRENFASMENLRVTIGELDLRMEM